MLFPDLETPRLKLTQLSQNDAASILTLFSNEAVIKYYDLAAFDNIKQATDLITLFNTRCESGLGIRWAIRLKETNELIGTCGFNSWNEKMKQAVLGYDLLPSYWRGGYTSEAVEKIIQAAFSGQLACADINRIQADTIPGNVGSEALLLKVGFKKEGLRREAGYWKNQFHDLWCFGLIKSDYNGR
jgi:ribosomal-protein-alanine N-acetyltransferase